MTRQGPNPYHDYATPAQFNASAHRDQPHHRPQLAVAPQVHSAPRAQPPYNFRGIPSRVNTPSSTIFTPSTSMNPPCLKSTTMSQCNPD